jgi:hypothetical protein
MEESKNNNTLPETFLGERNDPYILYQYNNYDGRFEEAVNLAYLINSYTRRPVNYHFIKLSTNIDSSDQTQYPEIIENDEEEKINLPLAMLEHIGVGGGQ